VPHWTRQQYTPGGIRRWTGDQTEILEHVTVLEQVTMAALEGYLSGPLYHRAAHAVQRLLALTETMAWCEGTHVAHAMARLFCSAAAFGLVQALHLSELLAAFYREMAQTSAGRPPSRGWDAVRAGGLAGSPATSGDDIASATETLAEVITSLDERVAGTERSAACGSV
jgi:hypothetical protein